MAWVSAASSWGLRPRRKMAMRSAAVCASVGDSGVRATRASMKPLISEPERVRPSLWCWMTSMGCMVIGSCRLSVAGCRLKKRMLFGKEAEGSGEEGGEGGRDGFAGGVGVEDD